MSDDSEAGFLQQVYDLAGQKETDALYSAWADTYDNELVANRYRTPQRCADALARVVALDAPVLDVGCGTGLSGKALASVGFTEITGHDVNPEMLEVAKAAGIYREVAVTDTENPFPFAPGTFAAITAVGVIGVGAAPIEVFGQCLAALGPGGHFAFSFNDHALAIPEYPAAIEDAVASGIATVTSAEDGPHIEALGSRSTVYVLQKRQGQ